MPAQPVPIHGPDHGPNGPDPTRYAGFEIIVFGLDEPVSVVEEAAFMIVPESIDGLRLMHIAAGVFALDTGDDIVLTLRNYTLGENMLTTSVTIDEDEYTSYTSAAPPVIDPSADSVVATGDRLVVEVISCGTVAQGLAVIAEFA